jgi:hypothetical protein
MFHPVGSLPPRVYWRRRAFVIAVCVAALVLAVLTLHAASSKGGPSSNAAGATPSSPSRASTSSSPPATTPGDPSAVVSSPAASSQSSASSAVLACVPAQLTVVATTEAPAYKVGDQPVVVMQVTNTGTAPCSTALGDPQIEFRVYNGSDVETLPVNTTIAKTVTWSGFSSEASCAGTRQKVGAGTYSLYAYLNGVQGTPSQFTIS